MADKRKMDGQRLDRLFIDQGFCSSRGAKAFFERNRIFLNDIQVSDRKIQVTYSDRIFIESPGGKKQVMIPRDIYIALNKPAGFVCSHVSDSHRTIYRLTNAFFRESLTDCDEIIKGKLHSVGRLDCESRGLLIITSNGRFSHYVSSPESGIKKTYLVELAEAVDEKNQKIYMEKALEGIILPAEKKAPEEKSGKAEILWIDSYRCQISVSQGKFHEVRRIFKALENQVVSLERTAIGRLKLEDLNLSPGKCRLLDSDQLDLIIGKTKDF